LYLKQNWQKLFSLQHDLSGIDNIMQSDRVSANVIKQTIGLNATRAPLVASEVLIAYKPWTPEIDVHNSSLSLSLLQVSL